MLNLHVPKKWFFGEKFISEYKTPLRWLKTVSCYYFFILFFFLRLLEIGAIFQAWNCTVSNGCAFFMVTLQLYLSLCLSHKLRWGC